MKKKIILIATFLVIVATAVAVVSCKKERHDQNANGSEQTVQTADNMDEYLMAFKKKLLSAEKGGETISLEQAERDLGNLLNFDFGDANYATDVFQHDTIHAKLTLTDGQVDLSQLAVTYYELLSQTRETYNQANLPNKSVYFITCSFSDNAKEEKIDVEIILTMRGLRDENTTGSNNNGWRPTNHGGSCDGTIIGCGAPEELAWWLNRGLCLYGCPDGQGRVYFEEVEYSYKNSNSTDMIDTNSPCGYKLYVSWEPNQDNVCISNSELLYYYYQARSLWDDYDNFLPNHPSDHVVVSYEVCHMASGYNFINGQHIPQLPYIWQFKVGHAKLHCTPLPPEV